MFSERIQTMLKKTSCLLFFILIFAHQIAQSGEGCGMTNMPELCKEYISQRFGGGKIDWDPNGGSGGYSESECFSQVCSKEDTFNFLAKIWKATESSNKHRSVINIVEAFGQQYSCPDKNPVPLISNSFGNRIPEELQSSVVVLAINLSKFCGIQQSNNDWIKEEIKKKYLKLPDILNVKWESDIAAALTIISSEDLRLYRNAIFAKYGRTFRDQALQAYFDSQSWYIKKPGYSDSNLSEMDKNNIQIILKIAKNRKKT